MSSRVPEPSVPATIRGLNLICAATWDASQGIPPAGGETEMDLMICAWAVHQGTRCVSDGRGGLFRAVQCVRAGGLSEPPAQQGHDAAGDALQTASPT